MIYFSWGVLGVKITHHLLSTQVLSLGQCPKSVGPCDQLTFKRTHPTKLDVRGRILVIQLIKVGRMSRE